MEWMKVVHFLRVMCMDSGKSETRCTEVFPMSINFAKECQGSVQRQLDGSGVSASWRSAKPPKSIRGKSKRTTSESLSYLRGRLQTEVESLYIQKIWRKPKAL